MPMSTSGFATYCSHCDASVAAVPTETPGLMVLVEHEEDRCTPSPDRHVCWPRGQRIGRLIAQRRARIANTERGSA